MRAVVLGASGRVEVVSDWAEPPPPGPEEVTVAVRAVGLCGSDLAVVDGKVPTPTRPWVLGHEGGGRITDLGSDVTGRSIGQRVVIEPNYPCGRCDFCLRGRTSACERRRAVGINVPGLLAEHVVVPAHHTWPVPDDTDDALLACIEPLAVARAAVARSGIEAGQDALVVGAGSQGLLLCQALLAHGARPRVVEPHEGRRELAERLGAMPHDGHEQLPFVFNTADAEPAWDTALAATASDGIMVMVGMSDQPVALSTRHLVRRQLTIRGSLIYDHPGGFPDTIGAVTRGEIRPTETLQKGFHPDDAADAFDQARQVPGKSWIRMAEWQHLPTPEDPA
ncbi:MAG TPA: alcohol dehydrogenase catalytic domain-containing protein [Egicoccus sp.]|nr:alcohol dehydrogenase catalytic domain-containing protein [Egicoccus sp.]HSK24265.1 alcohol dehydrogenase catalytic domain-containing protein [Egicoccus sp.]